MNRNSENDITAVMPEKYRRSHNHENYRHSRRNTPPNNVGFDHSAYRRIAPHAVAPIAEIWQQVSSAFILTQNLKGPICWRHPLVKFT
jgi:hypothetical protein